MPRLILVRHAEPAAAWGDHDDPGLSDLGREQAAHAAKLLMLQNMKAIVTSPLARCRETALAFEGLVSQKARVENAVAEIPTPQDIKDRRAWLHGVLGGQWANLGPELGRWRDGIGATLLAMSQDTVVFSHFVAINAAIGLATNARDVVAFRPGHASRTELFSDGKTLKLIALGDEAAISLL